MSFPFYIARRYLFSKKSHNAINVISGVSVCGVALATLALVCTLSVFNGFQDLVTTMFTAFDPEIKITAANGKVFDAQDERIQSLKELYEIEVFSESLEDNAMVQYKGRQTMVVIKGIEDNLPELPESRKKRLVEECGLAEKPANFIVSSKYFSNIFDEAVKECNNPKTVAAISKIIINFYLSLSILLV